MNHSKSRDHTVAPSRAAWIFRGLRILLILSLGFLPTACATFSDDMGGFSSQASLPNADDPEANGNPNKAWWN